MIKKLNTTRADQKIITDKKTVNATDKNDLKKLIEVKLQTLSNILKIDTQEMALWFSEHSHIHQTIMLLFLRIANRYALDPTIGEIIFIQVENEKIKPFVTTNGWIRLIHRENQFDGMVFNYPDAYLSEPINKLGNPSNTSLALLPAWVECTIWKKDCAHPITVREYLQDSMTQEIPEQDKALRLLRKRALSACAKIAFGITTPELYAIQINLLARKGQNKEPINQKNGMKSGVTPLTTGLEALKPSIHSQSRSALLKQTLQLRPISA